MPNLKERIHIFSTCSCHFLRIEFVFLQKFKIYTMKKILTTLFVALMMCNITVAKAPIEIKVISFNKNL